MKTVTQVADWIMEHRGKGKAFVGYSYQKVIKELLTCAERDSMVIISNGDNIVGVVCGFPDTYSKVFHVYEILTIEKGVLKRMVEYFNNKFPNYSLQGTRKNGKIIAYNNMNRFSQLINIYGK